MRSPTVSNPAETSGVITLQRMRRAAEALECDLAVVLVPRRPFEETLEARADKAARRRIERVGHSMALEAQNVETIEIEEMVDRMAREMIERADPDLWMP